MELNEQTLYALLAVGIMLLVGFPVHEFCHAYAAYRLGDSTARWQGRLTLNPKVHFDQVGGVMLAVTALFSGGAYFFGYAKPTPVNPMNLQGGRRGEAWVAAAGPVSNLIMAAIVALPLRLIYASPEVHAQHHRGMATRRTRQHRGLLRAHQHLPVHLQPAARSPLDGWKVLGGLVPPQISWQMRNLERQYAQIIPLLFLGFILLAGSPIIGPLADRVLNILLGNSGLLFPVIR